MGMRWSSLFYFGFAGFCISIRGARMDLYYQETTLTRLLKTVTRFSPAAEDSPLRIPHQLLDGAYQSPHNLMAMNYAELATLAVCPKQCSYFCKVFRWSLLSEHVETGGYHDKGKLHIDMWCYLHGQWLYVAGVTYSHIISISFPLGRTFNSAWHLHSTPSWASYWIKVLKPAQWMIKGQAKKWLWCISELS